MRLMAARVGPTGSVTGVDVDDGLRGDAVVIADVETAETVPGAPFDLVSARLLLLHMSDPATVLRRPWSWVAPGGVLVIQDFDLASSDMPDLESTQESHRVVLCTFETAGRDRERLRPSRTTRCASSSGARPARATFRRRPRPRTWRCGSARGAGRSR
jgi:ubiquinone/menaquinone biosynthesis C-methylase UbiE